MSNLSVYAFDSQEIRFIDGKPVANDVAQVLGYADPQATISKKVHPKNKGVAKMETPGGVQRITVLEEAGIYQLIFSSKLESAQRFQDWVFEEVLPSIRKTGSYSQQPTNTFESSDLKTIDFAIDAIFKNLSIKPELVAGIKLNAFQLSNPGLTAVLEPARQLLIESTAQTPDHQLLTVTELGKELGISAQKFNQLLIEKGFQIPNPNKKSRKDLTYIPSERGHEFANIVLSSGKGKDSTTYQQLRWDRKILLALC